MDTVRTDCQSEFSDLKRDGMMKSVSDDAPSKLGIFRSVYSRQASARKAIKAKCLECCWLEEAAIRGCTATECPLWHFRPYQSRPKPPRLTIT